MTPEETLALFKQGKDAWNAWAEEMLAKRKALEEAGEWAVDELGEGQTDATEKWLEDAKADFLGREFTAEEFPEGVDFGGFIFAGVAGFDRARFKGAAGFDRARFEGAARFDRAGFEGAAGFLEAGFKGAALFDRARFEGAARFDRAGFEGAAGFDIARFEGAAWFVGAGFKGAAGFDRAKFEGAAWFVGAGFEGDAWFFQASFESYTTFERTQFDGPSNFGAIEVKSAFALKDATFKQVPDFIQADFPQAPRLDELAIQPRDLWERTFKAVKRFRKRGPLLAARWRLLKMRVRYRYGAVRTSPLFAKDATLAARQNALSRLLQGDKNLEARWRALKKLAEEAKDHPREQEFFKGELRARRWNSDWPWHPVFWFALVYEALSGFGRSFLRPVFWLIVTAVVFGNIYLGNHRDYVRVEAGDGDACVVGPPGSDAVSAARALSLRNTIPFAGLGAPEKLNQVYRCLYGVEGAATAGPNFPLERLPPRIPDRVVVWGVLQTILSAVLIFLFLLAVRNHFRIK